MRRDDRRDKTRRKMCLSHFPRRWRDFESGKSGLAHFSPIAPLPCDRQDVPRDETIEEPRPGEKCACPIFRGGGETRISAVRIGDKIAVRPAARPPDLPIRKTLLRNPFSHAPRSRTRFSAKNGTGTIFPLVLSAVMSRKSLNPVASDDQPCETGKIAPVPIFRLSPFPRKSKIGT